MSLERVQKTLVGLGFSEADAKIYVYLSKAGLQKGREISKAIGIKKQLLYPCLKNLQNKGIVSCTLEHPTRFSAVSFEKVLDLFVKTKLEEAERVKRTKDEILSDWKSILVNNEANTPTFMILEGRNRINSRIKQMLQEAHNQVLVLTTVAGLLRADQMGLFDDKLYEKSKAKLRFLTEINSQNIEAAKRILKELTIANINFQGRNPLLGLKPFPRMIIKDNQEILFFINPSADESANEQDDTCLWTDCHTLVNGFVAIFEELWSNSIDINAKISEVDTKIKTEIKGADDPEFIKKELENRIETAQEEIVSITSTNGLIKLWEQKKTLTRLHAEGVTLKILAPIVRENFEVAQQLSKISDIRHVSMNYVGVTIIDGKHLFQEKGDIENKQSLLPLKYSTTDPEYILSLQKNFAAIWNNSQPISSFTLESLTGPSGPLRFPYFYNPLSHSEFIVIDTKPPGTITEKSILNKIVNARKYPVTEVFKDKNVMYASAARAIIRPPPEFKLPDMLILVNHIEKQSSLGAADVLEVQLLLDTPEGKRFVTCGGIGDNPKGVAFRKKSNAGTPFEKNYMLVPKNKLQVRVYGNTLFVAWNVPIPLLPPKYMLPPGSLIFEGYGTVKTNAISYLTPSGLKCDLEENWFDAFVTFMHPTSKYSGSGTDGRFIRDLVLTMTPNFKDTQYSKNKPRSI